MRPKTDIDKLYCKRFPVRENTWGDMKDTKGRVGIYIDQYETLEEFIMDVWTRFRPHGGKEFLEAQGVEQVGDSDEMVCDNKDSKFFYHKAPNLYLTRPKRYEELRQHYFCGIRKFEIH